MRVRVKIIRRPRVWGKRAPPARRLSNRLEGIAKALEAGADAAELAAAIRKVVTQMRRVPGKPRREGKGS